MKSKIAWRLFPLAALCFGPTSLPAQKYPPPFPREAARMLFENERVEVWDVTWPKGQPTAMHEHPVDQLSVTLVGGTKRVTRLGATPTVGTSERGQIVFTPRGTVHMEEGVSDVPERKIMIQVKASHPASESTTTATAQAFPREGAIKLLENARVVVWDYAWKSGQTTSLRTNNRDSVLVFLDGGVIRSVTDKGVSKDSLRGSDEVVYSLHSTDRESEEAVRGSPRAIIVELK
jgi:quercetin dioxygenase-like cupin family protein